MCSRKKVMKSFIAIALAIACLLLIMFYGQQGRAQLIAGNQRNVGKVSVVPPSKIANASRPNPSFEGAVQNDVIRRKTAPVICKTCCYRYMPIERGITRPLKSSELQRRGCLRRLPDAIIIGIKKSGTGTLGGFLSYHPDIAFAQKEMNYFTRKSERNKGLEYYKSLMAYSTPGQVTMERTSGYYFFPTVPALMKEALPNVKLLVILKDPIERAVSGYTHERNTLAINCTKLNQQLARQGTPEPVPPHSCRNSSKGHYIADTFDESVIVPSTGRVNSSSHLVSRGVYVNFQKNFLKYFPPDRILALDGNSFIHDPYLAVKKVERFLGIRDYFRRDHFYFDTKKGFFCLDKPIPRNCMKPGKGRPHPHVLDETISKLRDFYRPYNKALFDLLGMDFYWSY